MGGMAHRGRTGRGGKDAVTHYIVELALWMAAAFLIGCPLGAMLRGVFLRRRGALSSGTVSSAPTDPQA